jgi:hypothetical protein
MVQVDNGARTLSPKRSELELLNIWDRKARFKLEDDADPSNSRVW